MIMPKMGLLNLLERFKTLLFGEKKFLFTFTYYVPAPPKRDQGYQEKHFDKVIRDISKLQITIKNIQTVSNPSKDHSGMWVVCLLKGTKHQMDLVNNWEASNDLLEEMPSSVESLDEINLKAKNEVELPEYNDQIFKEHKIKGLYHIK